MKRTTVLPVIISFAIGLLEQTTTLAQIYVATSSWGGPGGGQGTFNYPTGVAVDRSGNVYVADVLNHRVQKFSSNGGFLLMWGKKGSSPGEFDIPMGVAIDTAGTAYVADPYGSGGLQVFTSEGLCTGKLQVIGVGVATSKDGFVYVVGDTVSKYNLQGGLVARFGKKGISIAVDDSGYVYVFDHPDTYASPDSLYVHRYRSDGRLVNNWSRGLYYRSWPVFLGIAVDSAKHVYISSPYENKILKYSVAGELLGQVADAGTETGQFQSPQGIAVTPSGNLVVADANNYRIQVLTRGGTYVNSWGQFGGMGDGHFNFPHGLALDTARGVIYVADFWDCRIQKFTLKGEFIKKWSTKGTIAGQFMYPEGIAVNRLGDVYVNDAGYCRVQRFDSAGRVLWVWGSQGSGSGQFRRNSAIATDKENNVYVTDDSNRVQKFTANGSFLLKWGSTGNGDGQFLRPRGVVVDDSGFVYVVDHGTHNELSRVQKFTSTGTFVGKWILDINKWDGSPRLAGMAFDKFGNLFVVDDGAELIFKFTRYGDPLSRWSCTDPSGIGVDAEGNVYVVSGEDGGSRITKYVTFLPVHNRTLDFGAVGLGDSVSISFFVRNPHSHPLTLMRVAFTTSEYSSSQRFPLEISVGDSAAIVVCFKPSSFGMRLDTMTVASDAGYARLTLTGETPCPFAVLSTHGLDFGVLTRDSTRRIAVAVTNTSISPLRIDSLYTGTKYFRAPLLPLPVTVKRNDSLKLIISFTPDSASVFLDSLYLVTNSVTGLVKLPLQGEGTLVITSLHESDVPNTFRLLQNHPNPFNPSTKIVFEIPRAVDVSLKIYDVLGRAVTTLVEGLKEPGRFETVWHATMSPSGIYFYRLQAGAFVETKRMILLR